MASLNWCRLAKLRAIKGVSRSVSKLFLSTDVTRTERLVDRVKKFVFGEGAPPDESEETLDRFVSHVADQSVQAQPPYFYRSCHKYVTQYFYIL